MKGVFLQQQLEFRLEVLPNTCRQGDVLNCSLVVKNHSSEPQSLEDFVLHLALGDLKKVRQKIAGAFTVVSSADLPSNVIIEAAGEVAFSWQVQLTNNAVIADRSQSLFFLFGNSSRLDVLGQLPLVVEVHSDLQAIFSVFEADLQFVVKSLKHSKGWTVAKIQPSSAPKYALIDQVTLSACFMEDVLELKYVFDMKKFNATASTLGVKKTKETVLQTIKYEQYKKSGFVEHQIIEDYVKQALTAVL